MPIVNALADIWRYSKMTNEWRESVDTKEKLALYLDLVQIK